MFFELSVRAEERAKLSDNKRFSNKSLELMKIAAGNGADASN